MKYIYKFNDTRYCLNFIEMQKDILSNYSKWVNLRFRIDKSKIYNEIFKYLFPKLHQKCIQIHLLHNKPINHAKNTKQKKRKNDILASVFTIIGFIILLLCLYNLIIFIKLGIFNFL